MKRRLGVGVFFFPLFSRFYDISKAPTRGRSVFFSTFFTILHWEIDFFCSKKVSFGSHERKTILKNYEANENAHVASFFPLAHFTAKTVT